MMAIIGPVLSILLLLLKEWFSSKARSREEQEAYDKKMAQLAALFEQAKEILVSGAKKDAAVVGNVDDAVDETLNRKP